MGLVGTISPQIGNLTFLKDVDLSSNEFNGQIPGEIGRLFRLRYLTLFANAITGELGGVNISSCVRLRKIHFSQNDLRGKLPAALANNLKKLQLLSLGKNQLTGEIPPDFGNFSSSLQALGLEYNHLEGSIPNEITMCSGLTMLSLGANNLSGTIPSALFNMTSVTLFSVSQNSLQGTLPSYIGDTMPNLEEIYFADNAFHGTIPISFPNASKLQHLEVSENYLVGKVPDDIGKSKHLLFFNLEYNLLGSSSNGDDLAFITSLSNCSYLSMFSIYSNNFQGKLPNSIANLSSTLNYLHLGVNKLYGTIPIGTKNLIGLIFLGLGNNLLSGVIPSEIGELQKLQALGLHRNQFSGEIPHTLFNLTSLSSLYLSRNNLQGNIPPDVGNLKHLNELTLSFNKLDGTIPQQVFDLPSLSQVLVLSRNSFTGPLYPAVGKLKTLDMLDISGNKLSGNIPDAIGDCLSLEYLDIHDNLFVGKIPIPSLVSLKSIRYLDISSNKLSGEMPRELQNLPVLQYLNLSFNDLEGEVPTNGIFAVPNNVSLQGNKKLCAGIPELKLPACPRPVPVEKSRKHRKLMMIVILTSSVSVAVLILSSFIAFLTLYWRKDKRRESSKLSKVEKLSKITYSDLNQATDGFSNTNLIGSGSFGSVYKGRFNQLQGEEEEEHTIVAVKVLDLLKNGASKSFYTECEALRNIRHRNLVPIWTCCSSCDFAGNEFKALVYEFMENGDLDTWLHCGSSTNNNVQRLNIAIDVASALHYLHDDCEPKVIHCDLKPSNILLDKELTAHVGDFGISRLLYSRIVENSSRGDQEQTCSLGLKGSIGYVPPEYGIGSYASSFGDVYSFGVVLLEMFTAKRPVHDFMNDGCTSLYEFVETATLAENVMKIVDPLLLACHHGIKPEEKGNLVELEESKMNGFFLSVFKIGLTCASTSPMDRMHTNDVTRELHKIKKAFFV